MYSAIIWDLDGTLIDTSYGVKEAVVKTLRQLNLEKPDNIKLAEFVGPPMQDSFKRIYKMDAQEALKAANIFRDNYKETVLHAEIYTGILELLSKLYNAGVKMAIATNKSHDNASFLLEKSGIDQFCQYIIGSDREGKLKKSDLILKCCERLNIQSWQAVYVGDSELDYEGCQLAGIDFVGVSYGFGYKSLDELQQTKCLYSAGSVNELNEILFSIFNLNCSTLHSESS